METLKNILTITYEGRNVTEDLLPFLMAVSYTDRTAGESDELDITLEDSDDRWSGKWLPAKGDKVTVTIDSAGVILRCGTFQVDEVVLSGARDTGTVFEIGALAAGIRTAVRSRNSSAHESKTLAEIARKIGDKHGLTVQGIIADIRIERVTQYRETDLAFLRRLAGQYGYVFSIRDALLVFTSVFQLEDREEVLTIERTECISWAIRDKVSEVYAKARIRHRNPEKKEVVSYDVDTGTAIGDALELRGKVENRQQGEARTKAALHKANSLATEVEINIPGSPHLVAGNNVRLKGFGAYDARYHITESNHSINRDEGYRVSFISKKVGK